MDACYYVTRLPHIKVYIPSIDNHLTSIITIDHISLSVEEWAEGMLLLEWIDRNSILSRDQASIINNTEYIGAGSDFTRVRLVELQYCCV